MFLQLIRDRVWNQNVATVQLLGLCPLLAVSNTLENAAGLSVASAFVLISSALLISSLRHWIAPNARLPFFVLVVSTFTTIAMLVMEALVWDLYLRIALFVQIIVTNCMILGRIEQSASKVPVWNAFLDACATAMGFAGVLLFLGAARQILTPVLPLIGEPPGAFILFGLMLALIQYFKSEQDQADQDLRAAPEGRSEPYH